MNMCSYNCYTPSSKESKQISSLSKLLKLVSEESRLKLLCVLRKNRNCVCELMKQLEMSQSLISHHLIDLKKAGLVTNEKRGLRVYYSLTEKGKHITNLIFNIPLKEVSL